MHGPEKSDFFRRPVTEISTPGMDRSILVSPSKKKETILATSFLDRLAFLNRGRVLPLGLACLGADIPEKKLGFYRGIKENQGNAKENEPRPGSADSKKLQNP